jgi:hypothetical protein
MGSGTWTVGPKVDLDDPNIDHQSASVIDYVPSHYPWAHIGDASDSTSIGAGGFNGGTIMASVEYNGELYVGGGFKYLDGQPYNYIAKWNGTSWSAVGTGMDDMILALTVFDGKLIAGGYFLNAGGIPAMAVAAWDGVSWSAMDGLVDYSEVNSFAIHNGELYAGGMFYAYNTGVEKWNGSTWEPVGDSSMYNYGWIYALASYDGKLIAGGDNIYINDTDYTVIASWDGSSWSVLGNSVFDNNNSEEVHAFYTYDSKLIVGGNFTYVGGDVNTGLQSMYVAAWNGDSWESMSLDDGALSTNSLQDYVGAITSFNGNLVVAGVFSRQHHAVANNIAMWDGSAWSDWTIPTSRF